VGPTRDRTAAPGWPERPGIAVVILAFAIFAVCFPFWPGVVSYDAAQTFRQGHVGPVTDWWTPGGALVLDAWSTIGLGDAPVFLVAVTLNVLGAFAVARVAMPVATAALATLIVTTFPPVYAQLAAVSRDSFFTGFALVAFGCLAHIGRGRPLSRRQQCLAAAAMAAAVAAFVCRQNGIVVVFVVALHLTFVVLGARRRSAVLAAAAASVVAVLGSGLVYDLADVRSVHPERALYAYDLAAMAKTRGEARLPAPLVAARRPGWITYYIDPHRIPDDFHRNDFQTLYPPGITTGPDSDLDNPPMARAETQVLKRAWRDAITDHPVDYLRARFSLAGIQLGITERPTDAYRIRESKDNFGYGFRFDGARVLGEKYAARATSPLVAIPTDLPWVFLLLGLAAWASLRRARSPLRELASTMLLAAVGNILVVLAIAPTASFRYVNLLPPVVLLLGTFALGVADERRSAAAAAGPSEAPA